MKKHIWKIVLAAVIIVVVGIGLAHYKEVEWIWDNVTAKDTAFDESAEDVWDGGESYVGLMYSDVSESDYVNLYIPSDVKQPPLFVLVHGGGFVTNDNMSRQARLMINYFRDHGFAVASVNYRLAQEATYPAAILDVKAAVRYLRAHASEYGYDAEHIAIWGESAGGYLATMAALTNDDEFHDLEFIDQQELGDVSARVDVLVDFYGVVDMASVEEDWEEVGLSDWIYQIANSWAMGYMKEVGASTIEGAWIGKEFSDMTEEEIRQISPLYYFEENLEQNQELSIWITHGASDITVPIVQSVRLKELAEANNVKSLHYEVIPHGKHADDRCYTDEQLEQIQSFITSTWQ